MKTKIGFNGNSLIIKGDRKHFLKHYKMIET